MYMEVVASQSSVVFLRHTVYTANRKQRKERHCNIGMIISVGRHLAARKSGQIKHVEVAQ